MLAITRIARCLARSSRLSNYITLNHPVMKSVQISSTASYNLFSIHSMATMPSESDNYKDSNQAESHASEEPVNSSEELLAEHKEKIKVGLNKILQDNRKGNPEQPKCGYSAKIIKLLSESGIVEMAYIDVLKSSFVREAIKEVSGFKTIPQVFIDGEFIGGVDILEQLIDTEDFNKMLEEKNLLDKSLNEASKEQN